MKFNLFYFPQLGGGDPTSYDRKMIGKDPAQFRPSRRDGRIVGRGTADMKGGLVSMLYGAAAASKLGLLDSGRIVLHLVCDEETGSAAGSGHLRHAGMIDPNAVAPLRGIDTDDADAADLVSRLLFRAHPEVVQAAWVRGRRLVGPGSLVAA